MRHKFLIWSVLLVLAASARAQVASHAPTLVAPKPAAPSATPTSSGKFAMVTLSAVGKPVVRVNGSVLTDNDLLREEYTIFPYARQHNGLPKAFAAQIRDGAMKMMVFEELVYQEAQRRKMTVPAEKVAARRIRFQETILDSR